MCECACWVPLRKTPLSGAYLQFILIYSQKRERERERTAVRFLTLCARVAQSSEIAAWSAYTQFPLMWIIDPFDYVCPIVSEWTSEWMCVWEGYCVSMINEKSIQLLNQDSTWFSNLTLAEAQLSAGALSTTNLLSFYPYSAARSHRSPTSSTLKNVSHRSLLRIYFIFSRLLRQHNDIQVKCPNMTQRRKTEEKSRMVSLYFCGSWNLITARRGRGLDAIAEMSGSHTEWNVRK